MKNVISNVLAVLWFFCVLLWMPLLLVFINFMIISGNIVMLKTGFSTDAVGLLFLFVTGIIFAITGWVPAFRKCYFKLPWLYPLNMVLVMHLVILSVSEEILAWGFEVISTPRHLIAIVVMIIQIILCRAIMCIYLKKHPAVLRKYDEV